MNEFLAKALKEMNQLDSNELEKLAYKFRTGLRNNYALFGKHAFRKHFRGQVGRSTFNASLWDVMSCGLSVFPEHIVEAKKEQILSSFYSLLEHYAFQDSITLGTNQVNRVEYRFNTIRKVLEAAIND